MIWLSSCKLIGVGTDCAASVIEAENGLIRNTGQNKNHVIGVRCVAHRANWSVLSSANNRKYIDDHDSVLKALSKYYQYYPK